MGLRTGPTAPSARHETLRDEGHRGTEAEDRRQEEDADVQVRSERDQRRDGEEGAERSAVTGPESEVQTERHEDERAELRPHVEAKRGAEEGRQQEKRHPGRPVPLAREVRGGEKGDQ